MAPPDVYLTQRIENMIVNSSTLHPQPAGGYVYQYGTAGFRTKADRLDAAAYCAGLAAAARSRKKGSQWIGIMITASHNPAEDNGIKIVDPMGEMLEGSWEALVTQLANAGDGEARVQEYGNIVDKFKISPNLPARIVVARDTRPSGEDLIHAVKDGCYAAGTKEDDTKDLGILTTPQLHYVVRCLNTAEFPDAYGEPTEKGYYTKISEAFKIAMKFKKSTGMVVVDCANGVGGPKFAELMKRLPSAVEGGIDIKLINADVSQAEMLNKGCGADYVKTSQRPPAGYKPSPGARYASFDGDADRLMCYFTDEKGRFHLLDGDRQATLAASYLSDLVNKSGLSEKIHVGVVQTAYANGASTQYLNTVLKLPVTCTPTGVKHLHRAAERFGIGVYFEANGHGTVLFSDGCLKTLRTYEPKSPAQQEAIEAIVAMSELINQAVGDAISDLLMIEVILAQKKWGPQEWLNTYIDLPNRLRRVEVPDRNVFTATDAERKLVTPKRCQAEIDATVLKFTKGRAFARASGTEDAVRVYAEAQTSSEADDLAHRIVETVKTFADDPYKDHPN